MDGFPSTGRPAIAAGGRESDNVMFYKPFFSNTTNSPIVAAQNIGTNTQWEMPRAPGRLILPKSCQAMTVA